jgi:hypothetical protein
MHRRNSRDAAETGCHLSVKIAVHEMRMHQIRAETPYLPADACEKQRVHIPSGAGNHRVDAPLLHRLCEELEIAACQDAHTHFDAAICQSRQQREEMPL